MSICEDVKMEVVSTINWIVGIIFTACYAYQLIYIFLTLVHKPKQFPPLQKQENRYAVMISARNEEAVIGNLIDSICCQTYPRELVDIYVVADNCTDNTATVAEAAGAIVFERFNLNAIGKGYALEYLFDAVMGKCGREYYDGYFIFDADNLLDPEYITEMDKAFSSGYKILTSYRNSKNYGTNWVSAGYSLWFLREARQLNNARMILGSSCAVSGTGFLFHRDIVNRQGGWKHFLLTEDIEFTIDNIIQGEKIGYCHTARLYDEQPETFRQSWRQRMRWAKGYLQVFRNYGLKLLRGIFSKRGFSCFDMSMTIMPAIILTMIAYFTNITALVVGLALDLKEVPMLLTSIGQMLGGAYLTMFFVGLVATIAEWKSIRTSNIKKIFYIFTFPLFMFTYIPISATALFKKVEWKPIRHTVSVSIRDMRGNQK